MLLATITKQNPYLAWKATQATTPPYDDMHMIRNARQAVKAAFPKKKKKPLPNKSYTVLKILKLPKEMPRS